MGIAKKNSEEIKKNDGRKNNKRLAPKPISGRGSVLPAKTNKAKKQRIASYAVSAMKAEFGSEKAFFTFLAERARKSYPHMKLFLEYAYGKPSDNISDTPTKKQNTPIIQFIGGNNTPVKEEVIDVTHE